MTSAVLSLLFIPTAAFAQTAVPTPAAPIAASQTATPEPLTPVSTCDRLTNVIDNGDRGHSVIGQWNSPAASNAYNSDQLQQYGYAWNRQTLQTQVRSLWKFDCVPAGQYEVFVTWSLDMMDPRIVSTNAPFTIFRNGRRLRTVRVNQRRFPTSEQFLGRSWAKIGNVQLSQDGKLQVNMANNTVNGVVLADAVYIRPVQQ